MCHVDRLTTRPDRCKAGDDHKHEIIGRGEANHTKSCLFRTVDSSRIQTRPISPHPSFTHKRSIGYASHIAFETRAGSELNTKQYIFLQQQGVEQQPECWRPHYSSSSMLRGGINRTNDYFRGTGGRLYSMLPGRCCCHVYVTGMSLLLAFSLDGESA